MKKIRRDDTVIVITGKDRGKHGKVLSVLNDKVLVKGVNLRIKNIKPTKSNEKGKRDLIEFPIDVSNVMYYSEVDKAPMKVSFKFDNDGKKFRSFRPLKINSTSLTKKKTSIGDKKEFDNKSSDKKVLEPNAKAAAVKKDSDAKTTKVVKKESIKNIKTQDTEEKKQKKIDSKVEGKS